MRVCMGHETFLLLFLPLTSISVGLTGKTSANVSVHLKGSIIPKNKYKQKAMITLQLPCFFFFFLNKGLSLHLIAIFIDNTSLILGAFICLRVTAVPCNCQTAENKRTVSIHNASLPVAHLTSFVISHFPVFHYHEQHRGL